MSYLQKLLNRTEEVFESHELASQWLDTPNRALKGRKPIELSKTNAGLHEVLDLLGRIEHGVFS